ncbi:MAG: transposase [Selenomonadaceae bacterium]|nr:transposase [Selenomonadaceae bacterium]
MSKNKTKVILRHVTQIRDTYKKRKETIERVFADTKKRHCLRYTYYRGLAKVKMQVALIFSCLNLKK